jgi:hypothetical protein
MRQMTVRGKIHSGPQRSSPSCGRWVKNANEVAQHHVALRFGHSSRRREVSNRRVLCRGSGIDAGGGDAAAGDGGGSIDDLARLLSQRAAEMRASMSDEDVAAALSEQQQQAGRVGEDEEGAEATVVFQQQLAGVPVGLVRTTCGMSCV